MEYRPLPPISKLPPRPVKPEGDLSSHPCQIEYRPLPPISTVKPTQPVESEDGKLTPDQIKHWRRVLVGIIGPCALTVPESEIQLIRDKLQTRIGNEE